MWMMTSDSLYKRLLDKELLDDFCELMFGQAVRYETLLEKLDEWGVPSSMGALSRFADSQRSEWSVRRARRQYEAMLADEGVDLDEAQRKLVAERLFNLAASPTISEKALLKMRDQEIALVKLRQDGKKLELAERRMAMLETQAAAAQTTLVQEDVTPEARVAALKQIFGLPVA
jgi:hypothetical protein